MSSWSQASVMFCEGERKGKKMNFKTAACPIYLPTLCSSSCWFFSPSQLSRTLRRYRLVFISRVASSSHLYFSLSTERRRCEFTSLLFFLNLNISLSLVPLIFVFFHFPLILSLQQHVFSFDATFLLILMLN